MAKKTINIPILSDKWRAAWTQLKDYFANNTFAQKFIRHDEKPFVRWYDAGNRVYREFPDEAKMMAWVDAYENGTLDEHPEIRAYEFTEGFTAPAPYTISFISLKDNQYFLIGDDGKTSGVTIGYSFKTVDGSNGVDEILESVDAYYTFQSTSGTHQTSKIYNAGTTVNMNIDEFLHLGTNTITIHLRGRSTGAMRTTVVTYYVVQLKISTTFDISRSILPNTNFSCTYTVTGQADKTVRFYVDGKLEHSPIISSLESTATRTQIFKNTDGKYQPGKHTLQVQAEMMAGDSIFPSNLLYYEFVITGIDQTVILIENVFPMTQPVLIGEQPSLTGKQYITKSLNWAYYSSDVQQQSATITWRLFANGNETTLATRNADVVHAETDRKPDPLTFMPTEYGIYQLQALIGGEVIEPSYSIAISENTEIFEAREGLTMKLSGLGRSNDEPQETLQSWADRGYSCQFSNMPFNGNSGYFDDAVVFNNGATGLINNKPFAEEIAVQSRNGNSVEIDLMSFNVDENDAVIFQIGDPSIGPALTIYPTKAVLKSRAGTEIAARFKADERVKLAFITHPNAQGHTQYPRFMTVSNNGVLAPAVVYDITDNFNIGRMADTNDTYGMIRIGNADGKAGIKIFYLRTYDAVINEVQELNNYIIDSGKDLAAMIAKNNIYQTGSVSTVDIDKIEGMVPLVKITGDVTPMIATQSKATIFGAMEITFPENPELNISCSNAQFSNAGQSTLGLHMPPSMHVKLDKNGNVVFDRDGNPLYKNRWAFRAGNIPEKKFRLQANPMDSSCCHNGAFLRMVNETYKKAQVNGEYVLRIPAQQYVLSGQYASDMAQRHGGEAKDYEFPYNINYVPDSRPCVVVWRANENTPYTMLGLYVIMEEKKANYANGMRSIYDKIATDGTLDPYDFKSGAKGTRLWDNDGCRQVENLRNDIYTLFTSANGWDANASAREMAYELIYPDPDDIIADGGDVDDYWEEFGEEVVKPIAATYNNQSAFDAIIFDIIDKWHTAAYYSRVMRNTCSDSLVRNLEWTRYSTGGKWIPKWWDVDMQCGLQQSGACDAEPMTDRDTMQNGNYVLSGRDTEGNSSWLWDALENNDEFMDAVHKIDQALYAAGWTYDNIVKMQDEEYVQKWAQSLYNKDGMTKYVEPYFNGYDYLTMFQGDRTSHRHWFERTSYDYWDAKWAVGEFKDKSVYVRAGGANNQNTMYFVAGATSYFGYGQTQDIALSGLYYEKGDAFSMQIQSPTPILGNDPIQIYACDKLDTIDLHEIARYIWSTVQLDKCYDEVTGTLLKKCVVGISKEDMAEGIINLNDNIAFTGLDKLSRMEWFDIQGLSGVTSIDLSAMSNLKKFFAAGSGLLSFNPADGADFEAVELPVTLTSIVANGVSFTDSLGDCAITWWDDADEDELPSTLLVLRLVGMGSDSGTHELVHQWCAMLRDNPSLIASAQIQYRNINWTDIDIDDLLTLAQIPAAQRDLTGYVKCTTEYTTAQMSALMEAFGENVFTLANASSSLCCDCDSRNIIVSASGNGVSVDAYGVIEVMQGESAQLQAVGFPILGEAPVYEWHVLIDGDFLSGSDFNPNIPFDRCTLGYLTGILSTTECSDDDLEYTIYVERNTGGNGTATVRVKKRTYPTVAMIELTHSQAPVSELEGVLQILSRGHYLFDASHKRIVNNVEVPYTGRMALVNGGVWNLVGADSDYVAACTSDYLEGKTGFDEYCLQVAALPEEDVNMKLQYQSNWRNGLTLTAQELDICLTTILNNVVTNSSLTGNIPLFNALEAAELDHSDENSFNSMELKNLSGTLRISDLIMPSLLVNFESSGRNVLPFLKNVSGLDVSGCTGLTGITLSQMTWLTSYKAKNCSALVTIDMAALTHITSIVPECFMGCSALQTLVLPTTVTTLGSDSFTGTSEMLEVKYAADRVLSLQDTGIASAKGSLFVNDNKVSSYTGYEDVVEPLSDWGETALMWGDGTRIRFADGSSALIY